MRTTQAGTTHTHEALPYGNGPAWAPVADPVSDCAGCGRDCCPGCVPGLALADSFLELALALHGLGYSPVPVTAAKKPIVKWYPFRIHRPTVAEVREMFSRRDCAGAALIGGKPHGGAVFVDGDSEAEADWMRANLPATRWTRTRRGLHAHFRHPQLLRTDCRRKDDRGGVVVAPGVRLDIKAFLGYVVGPGSRHSAGRYQPEGDWQSPVSSLPLLPESIARLVRVRPPQPEREPSPAWASGDSDPERAFGAYLAKFGPVPAEGCGSNHFTFYAASWAKAHAGGLTEAAFVGAIRAQRPEFTEAWVSAKWNSATGRRSC